MTVPMTKIKATREKAQPNAARNGSPCPTVLRFCMQRRVHEAGGFLEWLKSAFRHIVLSRKSNSPRIGKSRCRPFDSGGMRPIVASAAGPPSAAGGWTHCRKNEPGSTPSGTCGNILAKVDCGGCNLPRFSDNKIRASLRSGPSQGIRPKPGRTCRAIGQDKDYCSCSAVSPPTVPEFQRFQR